MSELSVLLDVSEPRVLLDRLVYYTDGRQWDMRLAQNAGVDAVTHTGMLLPLPFTTAWHTQSTGAYARLGKSDYSLTTPNRWLEHNIGFNGNIYLQSRNINEVVYTNAYYEKNRGQYISWVAYNYGDDKFVQIECGFGTVGSGVSLRFWSTGDVEVWHATALIGNGSLTENVAYPDRYGAQGQARGAGQRSLANEIVSVCIIPCRRRELLVLSTGAGGGFNFLFDHIDENDPDPTITDPGPFWWYVPSGQAMVQCAPLRYAAAGTLYSAPIRLRYPPPTGSTAEINVYHDPCGYGASSVSATAVDAQTLAPFVSNGTADSVRIRVDLSGDGAATNFVYGASITFAGTVADTIAGTANLTPYMLASAGSRLEVPESPADVRLTLTLKSPEELETGSAPKLRTVGNRPVEARLGSVVFFAGRTDHPSWSEAISDETRELIVECRDRWKAFELYRFQEEDILDGLNLGTAFQRIAMLPGFRASDMDIRPIDFDLPETGQASNGEWAHRIEVGKTVAEVLMDLHQTYCPLHYIGWVPGTAGIKFRVAGTADLGSSAAGTVYLTADAAGADLTKVCRKYKETILEPESNDVWVMGFHPHTKLPIVAHYAATASQNPLLSPGLRPDNWMGEPVRYAWVDPAIVTQEACAWAAAVLGERLTRIRRMAEWESNLLVKSDGVPIWRGDVVRIVGKGLFRVNTISCRFELENQNRTLWRPAVYTGEWIENDE